MQENLRIFPESATWPVIRLDRRYPANRYRDTSGHTRLLDRRRLKDKVVIVTGKTPLSAFIWDSSRSENPLIESVTWVSANPRLLGANSPIGIGRASAHQFAHNGAKAVYICDYDDSHLATHKREIESLYPGVDVHVRQFDAGDEASVKAVVDDAIKKYGRLDVMFANAGISGQPKIFTEITADQFIGTLKTNTIGYVQSPYVDL